MNSPAEDKEWGSKYLLGPLNEPEASADTGPGSHFIRASTTSKHSSIITTSPPPIRGYPTPPTSASPTQSTFHSSNPYSPSSRRIVFGDSSTAVGNGKGRQRGSSLGERFPGDMSHRPLDQIRKEVKTANRAPHLRKMHMPGADVVDSLDLTFGGPYHHGGPYDATLLARNTDYRSSPLEAVKHSNAEALRATPREYIRDALDKHVPLRGTAVIPPGMQGLDGRTMQYEEGADLMREADAAGGAYKRWDHVKYLPGDLKGKGEPSYSIEKTLKDAKQNNRGGTLMPDGSTAFEMQPQKHRPGASRQRSRSQVDAASISSRPSGNEMKYSQYESEMRRSNTTGNRVGEGLKKRFGTLRRKNKGVEV